MPPKREREPNGIAWLESHGLIGCLIEERYPHLLFTPTALAKVGAAFGFTLGVAQYKPAVGEALCVDLMQTLDGAERLYAGVADPLGANSTYIRFGEASERYFSRVPGRIVIVHDTNYRFSLAWSAYVYDPEFDSENVKHENHAHGYFCRNGVGVNCQFRQRTTGGINFHSPYVDGRPVLRFEDDTSTDRWSVNS